MADLPAGRDLRIAGARGARARGPACPGPAGRAPAPCCGAAPLVVGGHTDRRAGRGAAADAAHLPGSAHRRPAAGGHRAARPAARAGLRVPAGRRRPTGPGVPRGPPGPDRGGAPAAPACRRPDAGVRRPAGVAVAGRPAPAGIPEWLDRRGAAGPGFTGQRPAPLRRRRLQDEQARRPGAPADRARLHARADDRGDAALALPTAGAALLRRAAPLPALAAGRLRPGASPRRDPLSLRARHVRSRRRRRSTASRAACSRGTRRPRWCSSSPTCCPGRWCSP